MKIFRFLIIIFAFSAHIKGQESTQDFDLQDPFVDDIYQRGQYLVYDCDRAHWVCTGDTEFKACKRRRNYSLKIHNKNLDCAYFTKFSSKDECFKAQQELTQRGDISRFCMHNLERKRKARF